LIRVLHTEWSDGWGGQEIRIIDEMNSIRASGIEVYLACKDASKIKVKAIENNINVYTLPFSGNADLRTIYGLIKIIKKLNINIVNTHSGKDTWVGGIAAKIAGVKFIRTRHLSNPINKSKINFINQIADYIITTGESVREAMIKDNKILPNKISSVPSGPKIEVFDPDLYDYLECRKKFSIKNGEYTIGMLSVLRKFKRHDRFLKMARKMLTLFPHKKLKFLIAGEGPQRDNIEILIKKYHLESSVTLLGHIENQAEFLKSIDLFILASDSGEGVPQSLIQALMMNKLAVATDVGSVRDLYHHKNFKMVNKNKQQELIFEVRNIIENIKDNKARELDNRKFIIDNFSENIMTSKILSIYDKLINQ